MADSDPRLVRSFRTHAMRTLLAAALGTMLVSSASAAAPSPAKQRTLATRGPVVALAADGDRAALLVHARGFCARIVVWQPTRQRVVRLYSATYGCVQGNPVYRDIALAGTRAAWLQVGVGNTLETIVMTATLARPAPVSVAFEVSNASGYGDFARRPVGDNTLLAFTVARRCEDYEGSVWPCPAGRKTGDIVAATVWRVAGRGRCPYSGVRRCSRVATADGELSVLAVDAGRIAVRTDSGLKLLTASGHVLRDFDLTARQAALSGNRLAVRTADAVEVYDTATGKLAAGFSAASHLRLEDLDHDIVVTALGRTVTLRRLGDGRTTTIRAGGTARAQLEPPGLFVAAGRRVTFTPMREVLRRLGRDSRALPYGPFNAAPAARGAEPARDRLRRERLRQLLRARRARHRTQQLPSN
jgi:hypothetical protein